jgi:phosphatidate cytidylyltransferase
MIRTRVIVGSILALATIGILIGDDYLAPGWFPCLFACLMALGILAGRELVHLFPEATRPSEALTIIAILLCLATNWLPVFFGAGRVWGWTVSHYQVPLSVILVFSTVLIAAFLLEMYSYTGEGGQSLPRIASTVLAVGYLGVLPCFFVQIRFLTQEHTAALLALTIAVPKCNDVCAFFSGTFFGRHKMTPVLSPKKTWEGFAGGMIGGALVAVGLSLFLPAFGGPLEAVAFGLVVGLAGVFGDLAESLIKRDCLSKDSSKSIPGFGGLLDVVDSVLFAAPVAFLWFGSQPRVR